jgi:hypothetical protein
LCGIASADTLPGIRPICEGDTSNDYGADFIVEGNLTLSKRSHRYHHGCNDED